MKTLRVFLLSGSLFLLWQGKVSAQTFPEDLKVKYDTNYVRAFRDELTTRIFLSRKQNGYNLSTEFLNPWIRYRSNDNFLIGIGYTYSFLTLNLAVKMPFVNEDDNLHGQSKYFDLQSHAIFHRIIVDLYLQWTRGFYISSSSGILANAGQDPARQVRGDLRTNIVGLNLQYLFNADRYSYKAAFIQNEIQKKSAGSPIAGVEAHWVLGMTDSATVGGNIHPAGFLGDQPFNQTDLLNAGINGGYAYTLVWNQRFYASFSSTIGFSGGYNRVHYNTASETLQSGITFGLTNSSRISVGYNSSNYFVGISYLHFSMTNRTGPGGEWIGYNTGNLRLNFVKRFITKRPIKILRPDLWVF
jgi:hypothetical protein